jgi:hypothetical protein
MSALRAEDHHPEEVMSGPARIGIMCVDDHQATLTESFTRCVSATLGRFRRRYLAREETLARVFRSEENLQLCMAEKIWAGHSHIAKSSGRRRFTGR